MTSFVVVVAEGQEDDEHARPGLSRVGTKKPAVISRHDSRRTVLKTDSTCMKCVEKDWRRAALDGLGRHCRWRCCGIVILWLARGLDSDRRRELTVATKTQAEMLSERMLLFFL